MYVSTICEKCENLVIFLKKNNFIYNKKSNIFFYHNNNLNIKIKKR